MQTLNDLESAPLPIEEEERSHTRRLLAGVLCAVVVTGLLLGGYLYLQRRHVREAAAAQPGVAQKAAPRIEVYVDEATLDGKQTVLGGTIHNISGQPIKNVAVELELRKRTGGALETMIVAPEQVELAPDASVRYSVALAAADYNNFRLFRVMAGQDQQDIPFKVLPGAARPPMPVMAAKTVIVRRPAPKGEEFINTEKNPGRVP